MSDRFDEEFTTQSSTLEEEKNKSKKRRTLDEQIAETEKQLKQLSERKKKLLAQKSSEERKKRTKRLIELGGAVCKVLNEDTVEGDVMNDTDVADLIAFLKTQNDRGGYFTKAMKRTPKTKN